mgnify:CR=1 FL=1
MPEVKTQTSKPPLEYLDLKYPKIMRKLYSELFEVPIQDVDVSLSYFTIANGDEPRTAHWINIAVMCLDKLSRGDDDVAEFGHAVYKSMFQDYCPDTLLPEQILIKIYNERARQRKKLPKKKLNKMKVKVVKNYHKGTFEEDCAEYLENGYVMQGYSVAFDNRGNLVYTAIFVKDQHPKLTAAMAAHFDAYQVN